LITSSQAIVFSDFRPRQKSAREFVADDDDLVLVERRRSRGSDIQVLQVDRTADR